MRSTCHPATSAEPRLEEKVCRWMWRCPSRCRSYKSARSTNCCRPVPERQILRTSCHLATNRNRRCVDPRAKSGVTGHLQHREQQSADYEWLCRLHQSSLAQPLTDRRHPRLECREKRCVSHRATNADVLRIHLGLSFFSDSNHQH